MITVWRIKMLFLLISNVIFEVILVSAVMHHTTFTYVFQKKKQYTAMPIEQ